MTDVSTGEIISLDLKLADRRWDFADGERHCIDAHWQRLLRANPAIWNGRILMGHDVRLAAGRFSARFFETDYASFIAWRDWGWPDRDVFNIFGSALVVSGDGKLIYGRMAGDTLNAGLCYPPGGSLEPGDVDTSGTIDVAASVFRELGEETGLDARHADHVATHAIFDGQRISLGHVLVFAEPADKLVERCRCFIARHDRPELSAMTVMTGEALPDATVPTYAMDFVRRHYVDRALVPLENKR